MPRETASRWTGTRASGRASEIYTDTQPIRSQIHYSILSLYAAKRFTHNYLQDQHELRFVARRLDALLPGEAYRYSGIRSQFSVTVAESLLRAREDVREPVYGRAHLLEPSGMWAL